MLISTKKNYLKSWLQPCFSMFIWGNQTQMQIKSISQLSFVEYYRGRPHGGPQARFWPKTVLQRIGIHPELMCLLKIWDIQYLFLDVTHFTDMRCLLGRFGINRREHPRRIYKGNLERTWVEPWFSIFLWHNIITNEGKSPLVNRRLEKLKYVEGSMW
jgi:hypothetical protein